MKTRKASALLSALAAGLLAVGAVAVAHAAETGSAVVETAQDGIKVGDKAPDFTLTDTDGKTHTLSDYTKQGKIVVLEWFNPGCPWVVRVHEKSDALAKTAASHKDKVVWLAVNSGAAGKQGHGKELNAEFKKKWNINYPILLDESGKVGKSFGAKVTPHMFVIAADGTLAYEGAFDDSKKDEIGTPNYVADAITAVAAGETLKVTNKKPQGCSVKYAD
ncbi:MAG: thioredoxin family protein [Phycisphaeraceae bacterium]|nr:thioredoxin family protein [Phycisphaeraceae bacterium]MCW5768172.1 thioredoxin family protein [Phycisphaeraceae bacterium]